MVFLCLLQSKSFAIGLCTDSYSFSSALYLVAFAAGEQCKTPTHGSPRSAARKQFPVPAP